MIFYRFIKMLLKENFLIFNDNFLSQINPSLTLYVLKLYNTVVE